ncbi:DUF6328 family protein [Streptomyces sp. NPDC047108]|uniref:DUF6328 family protein n=1 Tax=Streptomyces sp. NPDC047108 TaxID=3155025 RepID=UPI0033DE9E36
MSDVHESPPGREETQEQQADRRWGELLQEVRVAQTGVQILLAFLLTVAFTPRFDDLGDADQAIYVMTVLFGTAAVGALIAPVSFHRMVFGRRLKPETVTWASRFTLVGLVLLLCTLLSALLLILRVVISDPLAVWLTFGALLWLAGCWFVPALVVRHRTRGRRTP